MAIQSANAPEIVTLDQWLGINRQSARTGMDEQECWWLENFFPVGPAQLRSGYGPSAPIYTASPPAVIRRIFFCSIDGINPLGFMFLDSGGLGLVDQVNLNTGAIIGLGPCWQPVAPNYWADLKLWQPNQFGASAGQSGGVVIGSPQGLFAWDGTVLTAPGQTAPTWLTGGAATTMPTGLPGIYSLEVYQERLFVMGQTVISFSAPGNGADFSTADGGGSFPYHGDQLTSSYTDLQASAGFLYLFGDSQTQGLSDLALVGQTTPIGPIYTTNFLLKNIDPQIGQRFFRPVGIWEQTFTLLNGAGVYALASASITWISEKITNLIATLNPTPFQPTMCPCHIFGKKWMLFNGTFTDTDGISRSMIICWSGPTLNQWVIASQGLNLTNIGCFEQNSMIRAYGTDGNVLVRLFDQPDPNLPKRIQTKFYAGGGIITGPLLLTIKDWKRTYIEMSDNYNGPEGVYLDGKLITWGGGIPNGVEEVSYAILPGGNDMVPNGTAGKGLNAGLDLVSLSPDFMVARIVLAFDQRTLYGA